MSLINNGTKYVMYNAEMLKNVTINFKFALLYLLQNSAKTKIFVRRIWAEKLENSNDLRA